MTHLAIHFQKSKSGVTAEFFFDKRNGYKVESKSVFF